MGKSDISYARQPCTMKSLSSVSAFVSVLARMARLKAWSSGANTHFKLSDEIG